MNFLNALIGVWLLSAALPQAPQTILAGKVVTVHSGDTFTIETPDGKAYKVRLEEVDAPEMSQTFGKQSADFLSGLILNQALRVDVTFVDKFGRRVGRAILAGGTVVNDEVIANGYAWHYRATPRPDERLTALERYAFAHSLGLWMQKNPVPPWEHRREATVPEAPRDRGEVDYDRVLHYGIVGDPKTRTYVWPACGGYLKASRIAKPVVFLYRKQAEELGYRPAGPCPS